MITCKKHVASVALVMLFAVSLLVSVPTTSAVFRQSITDLSAPSSVKAGEAFTVSIRVRYDFTGEGDVTIWARVRDPAVGDVGTTIPSPKTVHGAGEETWNVQVTARNTPGPWRLDAYALHWDAHNQEVVDTTKGLTVEVILPVVAPVFDFSVKVDPSAASLKPGDSALCGISVGLVTGQAQEVSMMYTIPPVTGVSASISVAKGTPPFNLMLKISTTTQTPPGTYTINVVGSSGSLQRMATVTLTVTAAGGFDFSVEVDPSAVSLKPGESASYTVNVELLSAISDHPGVDLSYRFTQAPAGLRLSGSFSSDHGDPPFTSTLRIVTTAQTPPGTYTIEISGVGSPGGLEKRAPPVTLTVTGGAPPGQTSTDWSVGDVWFLPSSPKPGDEVSFQAKISALSSGGPFPQQVSVDVSVDGRVVGSGTVLVPRDGVAVTVGAGGRWSATAGSHTVAFVADPQNAYNDGNRANNRRELSFSVASAPPPPPAGFDFSITAKPDSQSLKPEESMVYDVYVDLIAGTSDTVSLTLTGLPEDATYAFDPPTGLPYFPSKLTVYVPRYTAAGAPMPTGTYTLTVTAEAAGLVRTATTTLVIRASEVTTTQLAQTGTQATLTSTQTTGTKGPLGEALGGGGILLGLLVVVIVGAAVYYVGKRHKEKT